MLSSAQASFKRILAGTAHGYRQLYLSSESATGTEAAGERALTVNAVVCGPWLAGDVPSSISPRTAGARGSPRSPHDSGSKAPCRQLPTLLPHPALPPPGCRGRLGPAIRPGEGWQARPVRYLVAGAREDYRPILLARRTWTSTRGSVRSAPGWIGGVHGEQSLHAEHLRTVHASWRRSRER
jgi:hypothetical protein